MGYNRAGKRRKERLKRRRNEEFRVASKAAAAPAEEHKGLGGRVKDLAHSVAEKAASLAHAVADKVTGKGR